MKKKLKIVCFALCGALAIGAASVGAVGLHAANAASELVIPQEYKVDAEYSYGQVLNVPSPSNVRIKTGALETAAVSVVLEFPDGTAKSEGKYTLDRAGVYELTYYNANGVSATQTFVVNKDNYGVMEGTSASYVTSMLDANKEGVWVSMKDGTSFSFNKSIDLNDYADQELEVCKFFPHFRDNPDIDPTVSTVSVKVVDCYDSSKFVEFYIWSAGAGGDGYYAGAGASTQLLTGLEQNKNRPHEMTEEYEGELYKIHRPERYQSKTAWGVGLGVKASFDSKKADGNPLEGMMTRDGFTLIWDQATHQMKVKTGSAMVLLTDIDSAEIYGVSALDVDSFFTTGEVYLNVQAYNYSANVFEVGFEEIFGMSGDELRNATIKDTQAPQITVDVEPTNGNIVYLQKGKTMTLPKVKQVLDYNYFGDTQVSVYRNYGKPGQTLEGVVNGTFTPVSVGNYTAVYTAKDSYGNKGQYLLDMVVLDEQNIVYQPSALNKLVAAKSNLIPDIDASGLNKTVVTSVTVASPNGEIYTLERGTDGFEFLPEYTGVYTVTYQFKDNVYVEEYSYQVTCVDENSAAFKNPFMLPEYFMKGASYTVKPVVAYTAGNGGFNENNATVSVSVDGGAYAPLTAAQMQAYKVEASSTLQFKASYGDSFVESKVYSVVDVGYGKKTTEKNYLAYMQGNYTSSEMQAADPDNNIPSGAVYTFAGDASLKYINPISGYNFKTTFSVNAESVDSVSVVLRDERTPDKDYVSYTYMQSGATIIVNVQQYEDGKLASEQTVYTKYRTLVGEYSMEYSVEGMKTGEVVLENVRSFATDNTLYEIYVTGAENGCSVVVSQVANQKFSTNIREAKPQMYFERINGVQEGNSVYTIYPCYASSALGSVLDKDVTLTVTAPDGSIVTSVDGVRLDKVEASRIYQLKLSSVGQYRVSYAVSCLGSSRTSGSDVLDNDDNYLINVSEGIAPTIMFNDGSNENTTVSLKVGSTHTVKAFTVSDNHSSPDKIKTYVMILDKYFLLEENGYGVSTYVFRNKGEYIVHVTAYDELGNCSTAYYNVVVS